MSGFKVDGTDLDNLFELNDNGQNINNYFKTNGKSGNNRYYSSLPDSFSSYWKRVSDTNFNINGTDIKGTYGKSNFSSDVQITMKYRDHSGGPQIQAQIDIVGTFINGTKIIFHRIGRSPFLFWDGGGSWSGTAISTKQNVNDNLTEGHKYIICCIGSNGEHGTTHGLSLNHNTDVFNSTRNGQGGHLGKNIGSHITNDRYFNGTVYNGGTGNGGALENRQGAPYVFHHGHWQRHQGALSCSGGVGGSTSGGGGGQRQRVRDSWGYNRFNNGQFAYSGAGSMYYGSTWGPYSEGDRYDVYGGNGGNGFYGGGKGGSGVQGGRGDDDVGGGGGGGGSSFVINSTQPTDSTYGNHPIIGDVTGTLITTGGTIADDEVSITITCNDNTGKHYSSGVNVSKSMSYIISSDGNNTWNEFS
jgi:hypothetical protein